ncbi:hypothetical protein SAMN05660380_00094 [Xylella fastidiosa]|uniref:Uncharacterized protein n=1 Tax=Xylella fastidiosa (strain M23) TaxID=405441 RepID=B2I9C4_XYLF2|nr:hypothetical protein XfasM23_1980 [Xylella fastidiosa M23]MDS9988900.1 hypothetical protein [Xylella fastidiosa]SHG20896.1 hypothetical protein SAMN05660380_00094 [Xylella fastidiosa]
MVRLSLCKLFSGVDNRYFRIAVFVTQDAPHSVGWVIAMLVMDAQRGDVRLSLISM